MDFIVSAFLVGFTGLVSGVLAVRAVYPWLKPKSAASGRTGTGRQYAAKATAFVFWFAAWRALLALLSGGDRTVDSLVLLAVLPPLVGVAAFAAGWASGPRQG